MCAVSETLLRVEFELLVGVVVEPRLCEFSSQLCGFERA